MIGRIALFALTLSFAFASAAEAQETFLSPSRFQIEGGAYVYVMLSTSDTFPAYGAAPAQDDIVDAVTASAGRREALLGRLQSVDLRFVRQEADALHFVHEGYLRGLTVMSAVLRPRELALSAEDMARALSEVDARADSAVSYRAWAKAFVCVGRCAGLGFAEDTLGHDLEFRAAPEGALRRFQLCKRAFGNVAPVPVQNAPVAIVREGRRIEARTDSAGQITLPDDVHGPTMLAALRLSAPDAEGKPIVADAATLVFLAP